MAADGPSISGQRMASADKWTMKDLAMNSLGWVRVVVLAMFGLAVGAGAQDTRTVVEPRIPATCGVVTANLTPVSGALSEGLERHYRDNERIEKAMAKCPQGKAVVLRASRDKTVFLIGPIRMRAGVTLVVESNVAVWGSRDPRVYDVAPGSCGIVGERGRGCLPLILAEDAPRSGIMGPGVIDGRGGAKLLGLNETWWELAHRAKVEDLNQAVARLLVVRRSNDFTLYGITLRNSPNCHVMTEATNGFTAWGVKIDTPKWARNTDGIDPQSGSSNISIVESFIRAGDDNIAPKSNAAGGAVRNMTVRDTHFYNGHGMSIGSQTSGGVSAIHAEGLTIDGADNGLRIKSDRSRGGLVTDVDFVNVCMRGVRNPIVLTPLYTTFTGNLLPVYRNVQLRNIHSLGGGPVTLVGLDEDHRLEATLDNVVIDGERKGAVQAEHAVLTVRRGNLQPSGEDVRVIGGSGGGTAYGCEGKFVAFPENVTAPLSAGLVPPADETYYVAADGTGDYHSVQDAIDRVPATGGLVLVAPGVYRERVLIRQAHVTLRSANPDAAKTVIVYDTSLGTQGSLPSIATVTVRRDDFTAENITFQNDFNQTHKQEVRGSQAQALQLGGDRNVLRNVRLLGNQSTLYLSAKGCGQATGNPCGTTRTYLSKCLISGNVDFIYGDGTAYFDGCEIHSTVWTGAGFITAQGKHYAGQESQFVFRDCKLTADPGVGRVFLGRPWRDLSTVVFLNAEMGAHLAAAGWREWMPGQTHRLDTAYFRVYGTRGPGAAPAERRQLTGEEAGHYTVKDVLGGKDRWEPGR